MNGILVLSTNSLNIRAGIFLFDPAPVSSRGFFAFSIISTACLTAFSSAIGLRAILLGKGMAEVSSAAMSSGNSKCAAPGRSS